MTKKLKNLLSKWNVLAIALVAMMSVGLSSCDGDDLKEDIEDSTLGDYYFKFDVVDRGTLSDAQANQLVGSLNTDISTMNAYTKAQAVYVFDREIESLRVGFSGNNDFEVSLKASLMLKTSTIKSNIIHITRHGCTIE